MKNRLSELRAKRKFSQKDLGDLLKVSRQTIISIEKGKYNPSLELAYKIAQIFDCLIEDIFIYEEDDSNEPNF